MRGEDLQNHTLFSYVRPDSRIPANHPLRMIRQVIDEPVWDPSTCSKNRDRLLEGDFAKAFRSAVLNTKQVTGLLFQQPAKTHRQLARAFLAWKRRNHLV